MPIPDPRWLDVVRHRIRGFRAPFLLILQHHNVAGSSRLAAPVTLPLLRDVDVLTPRLTLGDVVYRVRLLDTGAVDCSMFADVEASALDIADRISASLAIILHGYPVVRPR